MHDHGISDNDKVIFYTVTWYQGGLIRCKHVGSIRYLNSWYRKTQTHLDLLVDSKYYSSLPLDSDDYQLKDQKYSFFFRIKAKQNKLALYSLKCYINNK